MKRIVVVALLVAVAASCADDRVELSRGPLGPSSYEVEVDASSESTELKEHRSATLRITPSDEGAEFTLRTDAGGLITAQIRRRKDGTIDLERVRGAPVDQSGEAELASLVGQLAPPLPHNPVRIGERWSSRQFIRTNTLRASLRTELGIARFRRLASTDTAELEGTVSGELQTNSRAGFLSGALKGRTRIAWAVRSGRVVSAETQLVWTLAGGDRVTLETRVQPI